ncbi:unnamed protein product [Malus baccata var. baccata]
MQLRPSQFTIVTPSLPSRPPRPHHRRRKHYHTIILQKIRRSSFIELVHSLCYLFESLTNGFIFSLAVNRERKYNHTCVVALQIGALSTNGSRQRIICKTNPKPFFPSSRSCQRLGIQLLCPSPSDVAPLEAVQKELRRRGKVLASKKSSRMAAEGFLALAQNENKAAIIELNCKTDFVARYLSILGKFIIDTGNRYILNSYFITWLLDSTATVHWLLLRDNKGMQRS